MSPAPPTSSDAAGRLGDRANPSALPRHVTVGSFAALIVLGLLWEVWLAPLRPGGSLLALKVLPLALVLPLLRHGHLRTFQWWSMLILVYLAEGLVRATSDAGLGATLGWIETALAATAFVAILLHVRGTRQAANGLATASAARSNNPGS